MDLLLMLDLADGADSFAQYPPEGDSVEGGDVAEEGIQ